ncbi:MAG: hypothetical protein IJQ79_10405 [Bacteroidales bacterium]|nr:hypothetical protein [Bacteroidales bacterium]
MDTPNIIILRQTERNALLITDGERVAWVQGRTRRADGSFTPSALKALANGTPRAEWDAQREAFLETKKAEKEAREKAREESKLPISITMAEGFKLENGSDKSYKVRTTMMRRLYGKLVHCYAYLPKSLVSVSYDDDGRTVLTMPRWYLDKSGWLKEMAIA